MSKREEGKIALGSGKLYIMEFTGDILTDEEIEVESQKLGDIKGGATITYTGETYEASDDLGQSRKSKTISEDITLKSGVITFNGKTLSKLCSTARIAETNGKRTVKVGGLAHDDGKSYLIRFVHEDKKDGDIRVTIVGKNKAGFSLAFVADKETQVDAEFKAEPLDNEGTLLIYEEELTVGA